MSKVDKMMSRPLGQETPNAHPCKGKSHCTTSNSGTPNPSGAQILLQLEPERRFGRLSKAGLLLPDLLVRVKQGKWHQTRPARRLLVVPAQPQLQGRPSPGQSQRVLKVTPSKGHCVAQPPVCLLLHCVHCRIFQRRHNCVLLKFHI